MSSTLLDFQDRLGLFLTALGASISLISVSGILVYAVVHRLPAFARFVRGRRRDASDSALFLNLMLADLIQAIGIMFNIKWVDDGVVTDGPLCTAQAVVKQIGINGVSATSLAITLYTFLVLIVCWNPPKYVGALIILGIWVFTGLVVGIPNAVHGKDVYYGQTGLWCWILGKYQTEQIVSEYMWVWLTGLTMLLLYLIMYLVLAEWIILENGIHWNGKSTISAPARSAQQMKEDDKAWRLFFYPAVYILSFLSNCIGRWLQFTGHNPSHRFMLFGNTIYALSGFFNFLVFFLTRKDMVIGRKVTPRGDDVENVPTRSNTVGFAQEQPAQQQNAQPAAAETPAIPLSTMRSIPRMEEQGFVSH